MARTGEALANNTPCRGHDELRNFLRISAFHRQHVSADRRPSSSALQSGHRACGSCGRLRDFSRKRHSYTDWRDPPGPSRQHGSIDNRRRGLVCEVTNLAACQMAIERVLGDFGRVDVLVNNAGITQPLMRPTSRIVTAACW
jgi:NAD(P)-dependent dehydrogenase (short-subunit alcohol dehydrogenase family)